MLRYPSCFTAACLAASSKRIALALIAIICLAVGIGRPACAQEEADLWDISQGVRVLRDSGTLDLRNVYGPYSAYYSDILNMFGGTFGGLEPDAWPHQGTLFQDFKPAGFIHFVEWRTPAPMRLTRFRLYANGDGPDLDNQRDFARFTLKIKGSSGAWQTIYDDTPTHPEYAWTSFPAPLLDVTLPSAVDAQDFRAEFVQYGSANLYGPRIERLQGFGTFLGSPWPRAPRVTVQKIIPWVDWFHLPLDSAVLKPAGWWLNQYVVVRNEGNAPAYDVNLDGAETFGIHPGYLAYAQSSPLGIWKPIHWDNLLYVPTPWYGLQPGEQVVVRLEYSLDFWSYAAPPVKSGDRFPTRISGSYYSEPANIFRSPFSLLEFKAIFPTNRIP
ncbi:MAG TPA: hypothetical protein VFB38_25345 [Chthonomonadaceae bacterium]|nr:hypothetical protein [Chthonomonadaceae bacterium]